MRIETAPSAAVEALADLKDLLATITKKLDLFASSLEIGSHATIEPTRAQTQIELLLREAPTLPKWMALPETSRQEATQLLALMLAQHARAVQDGAQEVRDE